MNRVFFVTFFACTLSFKSQTDPILKNNSAIVSGSAKETPTTDSKKVQLGINFSPDICFRTLVNKGDYWSDGTVKARNKTETIKAGYTAGLNLCFHIKKKVDFEFGLQYSNKGYQNTKKFDPFYIQLDPSVPNEIKFISNFNCIDIPVKVNFIIGKNKIRLITSTGVTTNLFINATRTTFSYYSDHTEKETIEANYERPDNNINFSMRISAGIDYKINERMNLRVEPTFTHGILTLDSSPIKCYLYNGGLNVGFYFSI